jgi:Ca2+-binding EF-hand superfamily protein
MPPASIRGPPDLKQYLQKKFSALDDAGSGELDKRGFVKLLKSLHEMKLSDVYAMELHNLFLPESKKVKIVGWHEFVTNAPNFIEDMYDDGTDVARVTDWAELDDKRGDKFWYNKRTGDLQWKTPKEVTDYEDPCPVVTEYMAKTFETLDHGGEGMFNQKAFFSHLRKMLLKLTDEQITNIHGKVDIDEDGMIHWQPFVDGAAQLIMEVYDLENESLEDDWCELPAHSGRTYYYNKRSGEAQWDVPVEDNSDEANEERRLAPPTLKDYLVREFQRVDKARTGRTSAEDFTAMLAGLLIRLTEEDVKRLLRQVHVDEDGTIEWNYFIIMCPGLLKDAHVKSHPEPCAADWVELPAADTRTYWVNKRAQVTMWEQPTLLKSELPEIKEYLKSHFKKFDKLDKGFLTFSQFDDMLQGMLLELAHDEAVSLRQQLDRRGDGKIAWNEFVLLTPDIVRGIYCQREMDFETDWAEIPMPTGIETYWYCKRTAVAQWAEPSEQDEGFDPRSKEVSQIRDVDEEAELFQRQGKYLEALECMEKSLLLRERFSGAESPEVWDACKVAGEMCNLLARSYMERDNLARVFELLKKAEVLTARDDSSKLFTFNNMALFYKRQNKLHAALRYLEKAAQVEAGMIARKETVERPADTCINLSAVYSRLGRHDEALAQARTAISLLQKELFNTGSSTGQTHSLEEKKGRVAVYAAAWHNVGVEQEYLKKFTLALESYRKGMAISERYLGHRHGMTIKIRNSIIAAKRHVALHSERQFKEEWKPLTVPSIEESRGKTGDPPPLREYLEMCFRKADKAGESQLNGTDFRKLLVEMLLNLSPAQLKKMNARVNAEGEAGTVKWNEFCIQCPKFLKDMYAKQEPDHTKDWCELPTAPGNGVDGMTYWYNKRTAKSQWQEPADDQSGLCAAPTIKDYLIHEFKKADADGSGSLDKVEFWNMLRGLLVGLTDGDMRRLHKKVPSTKADGSIEWGEFVAVAPALLRDTYLMRKQAEDEVKAKKSKRTGGDDKLAKSIEQEAADWVELPAMYGRTFWYNMRSGGSQLAKPTAIATLLKMAEEAQMPPPLAGFLRALFVETDSDETGSLDEADFLAKLKSSGLKLTDGQYQRLGDCVAPDLDGTVEWNAFTLAAAGKLQEIYVKLDQTFEGDWALLSADGGKTYYWYNKRTDAAQWDRPDVLLYEEAGQAGRDVPPPLEDYLERAFKRADADGSGELDAREFWACLKNLLINLHDGEIAELHNKMDSDKDGEIVLEEFVGKAKKLLMELYQEQHEDELADWCELPANGGGRTYWYNKRSGASQWEAPEAFAKDEAARQKHVGHVGAKAEKTVGGEKAPPVRQYLQKMFRKHDADGSGDLSASEFYACVRAMVLDFNKDEVEKLAVKMGAVVVKPDEQAIAAAASAKAMADGEDPVAAAAAAVAAATAPDADAAGDWSSALAGSGPPSVDWNEFMILAPPLIIEFQEVRPMTAEEDWRELPGDLGHTYWYNKRTGCTQWECPDEIEAGKDGRAPGLKEYLARQFRKHDVDGSGELDKKEFGAMLRSLLLDVDGAQMQRLRDGIDTDADGSIEWAEVVCIAPKVLRDIYAESEYGANDWCELPGEGAATYWYNKRSGRSQWEAPGDVAEENAGKAALKDWLGAQCRACDADNSGSIDKGEFETVLKTIWLPLNLSDEDARALRREVRTRAVASCRACVVAVVCA